VLITSGVTYSNHCAKSLVILMADVWRRSPARCCADMQRVDHRLSSS